MAKPWAEPFYNSVKWKRCRRAYIAGRVEIDGGMCEMCGRRVGIELDHIVELNQNNIGDPSVTLDFDNLQLLCHQCHTKKTLSHSDRVVEFDSKGNPVFVDINRERKTPPIKIANKCFPPADAKLLNNF